MYFWNISSLQSGADTLSRKFDNTVQNTQYVTETRLAELHLFKAAEFENDTEIFTLAQDFEIVLWPEISLFSTKY